MPPRSLERIAVIGAGNGGHAMAAHMTLKGFPVRFYEMPRFAANLKPAQERGGIELTGVVGEGFVRPAQLGVDTGQVVVGHRVVGAGRDDRDADFDRSLQLPYLVQGVAQIERGMSVRQGVRGVLRMPRQIPGSFVVKDRLRGRLRVGIGDKAVLLHQAGSQVQVRPRQVIPPVEGESGLALRMLELD